MSIRIDVNIGDERLRRNNKRRTAANQQALDARTQAAKDQQAAEQAAQEATPVERPSAVPDLRLQRRPAAQRRRENFKLNPIIIGSTRSPGYTNSVRVRTYTVTSGSEGVIYSVTPYFEAGLPEKSTGIIPGLKDSMLEAYRNYWNGDEVLNRPATLIGTLADFNEFFAGHTPNTRVTSIVFTDLVEKKYADFPRQYEDILVSAYVVDDTLQLIFYRSSVDAYTVTFNGTYGTTIGSVPTTRPFTVKSNEVASYETNCLVVTLNLVTKAVTKNTFTFHTFKTLRVLKSRRYFGGANNNLATVTNGFAVDYGYRNWRQYEENIYTTEFLNFLSNVFPATKIPFNVLPIFLGNFEQSYTYSYSDNPTEPRTSVFPLGGPSGNTAFTLEVNFLNPSSNNLNTGFRGSSVGSYHNMFSFLPYSNPLYAKNVSAVFDSYGFIDVPRWGSYDTRSGNRIVYGGPTAQPPSFSLLELEKVPFPKNAEELKKYSYPWPQSFVAYNQGTAGITSARSLFKLQALTSGTREAILSRPAPAFVATLRDLTAPSLPTAQRINAVNGAGIVFGSGGFRYDSDFVRRYSIPSVLYHITKK